jgi:hypothetical protein
MNESKTTADPKLIRAVEHAKRLASMLVEIDSSPGRKMPIYVYRRLEKALEDHAKFVDEISQ